MKHVVIIGGGAAGMMAAICSALCGHRVTILDQNEKLGKKLFITGKGRCNLTNACDISDFFSFVVSNPKFLYSAIYTFSNQDTISFFNSLGLKTKVERGDRVFPVSDKSSDVIKVLERELRRLHVDVQLHKRVKKIEVKDGTATGVILHNGSKIVADKVILATGGCSYPATGSTGDGYQLARELGHHITSIRPGLTGIISSEHIAGALQGLTLKNIKVHITDPTSPRKSIYEGFGELLFTHYGVSGPLMLTASSLIGDRLSRGPLILHIDLKPALDREQLDKRILRDFSSTMNSNLKNACRHLLPKSIVEEVLLESGLDASMKVHELKKENRHKLVDSIKDFTITLKGLRKMDEAIITRGGVSVEEVDPSTMESKLVTNLYFAGEVLDLDALTGGFNLQIAWSTGYLAGMQD